MENPCLKLDEYSKFNLGSAKNYPTKYSSSSPPLKWDGILVGAFLVVVGAILITSGIEIPKSAQQ